MPSIAYNTYQDVKNNLTIWTIILIVLSAVFAFVFLLTQPQQQNIVPPLLTGNVSSLIANIVPYAILAVAFVLGFVLVSVFQIHDVFYDRYVIRWREAYDIDFIIPALTTPFRVDLPKNFLEFAREHRYEFMKPFYDFVGDGKAGITHNTRVRFYERVTLYWMTQLDEIFLILLLTGSPLYILINPTTALPISQFALGEFILVCLVIFNRWSIRITREATSRATLDEIQEILSKQENVETLKTSFVNTCRAYSI